MLLLWWCPFKIQKEKWPGLQFTKTDYLSVVLTPLRICWTIPLRSLQRIFKFAKTQRLHIPRKPAYQANPPQELGEASMPWMLAEVLERDRSTTHY
jgi:hypothetical protein